MYLENAKQAFKDRGQDPSKFDPVYQNLIDDIIILFAEDSPTNIRYINESDLREYGISKNEILDLAIKNYKQKFTNINLENKNGVLLVTVDGDYEASAILIDDVVKKAQQQINGNLIMAIPSREVLLFTSKDNQQGIEVIKEITQKVAKESPYSISTNIFEYKNGKFSRTN
jgi:uncharacterized protein YtpQ (UPF0354 family)